MNSKNIALLTKPFNKNEVDAAITTVLTLAKKLKEKGHNPIIITGRGYKKYSGMTRTKYFEEYDGIKIYRPYFIPWLRSRYIFLDPSLFFNMLIAPVLGINYVEKKEKITFDICHVFGGSPIFSLILKLIKFVNPKIKLIYTIKSKSNRFNYTFFYKLLNLADVLTVPLNSIKKTLRQKKVFSKIRIINSFIDLSKFKRYNKSKIRKILKINRDDKIILYYGQFGEQKGVDVLLKAFALIRTQLPNSKLILLHPTYPSGKIKKQLNSELKKGKIIYVEGKTDVSMYLSASDVVVLPYKNMNNTELIPLCIIESIKCQIPVITSDFSEFFEIFEKNKDLLISEPKNHICLSKKIICILKNKCLQKRLIKNATKKLHHFDLNYAVSQFENVYLYD